MNDLFLLLVFLCAGFISIGVILVAEDFYSKYRESREVERRIKRYGLLKRWE